MHPSGQSPIFSEAVKITAHDLERDQSDDGRFRQLFFKRRRMLVLTHCRLGTWWFRSRISASRFSLVRLHVTSNKPSRAYTSVFMGGERRSRTQADHVIPLTRSPSVKPIVSLTSATKRNCDLEHDQPDNGRVSFLLFKPRPLAKVPGKEGQFSV